MKWALRLILSFSYISIYIYVKFCFTTVYNEETIVEIMKFVDDTSRVLYEEYQVMYWIVGVPCTQVGDSQAMEMVEHEDDS